MKMKHNVCNLYTAKCIKCGDEMTFVNDSSITVKIHSVGIIRIPNFFEVWRKCSNPLCEWSKIRLE